MTNYSSINMPKMKKFINQRDLTDDMKISLFIDIDKHKLNEPFKNEVIEEIKFKMQHLRKLIKFINNDQEINFYEMKELKKIINEYIEK